MFRRNFARVKGALYMAHISRHYSYTRHVWRVQPFPLLSSSLVDKAGRVGTRSCERCLKERRSTCRTGWWFSVCSVYIDWHYEADQSTLPVCLVEGSKEVVCEERDLRLDAPPPPSATLSFPFCLILFLSSRLLRHFVSSPIPSPIEPPDAEAYEVAATRGGEKRVRN